MNAKDFLPIAKKLLRYNSEANWRTSIGRSYYAVFNYLKLECSFIDIRISDGPQGHIELVRDFNNADVLEASTIGSKLNDLHTQRLVADYKLGETVSKATAELIYEKANQIFQSFPSVNKTLFQAGVKKYLALINNPQSTKTT